VIEQIKNYIKFYLKKVSSPSQFLRNNRQMSNIGGQMSKTSMTIRNVVDS